MKHVVGLLGDAQRKHTHAGRTWQLQTERSLVGFKPAPSRWEMKALTAAPHCNLQTRFKT